MSMIPEVNLALHPDVQIDTSVRTPSGGGSRDPRVLLNETALTLEGSPLTDFSPKRTYDTYDGQNKAQGLDWYSLQFSQQTCFNCIEITTGFPYPDGGWWTSLYVEVQFEKEGDWHRVEKLRIYPEYDFTDSRAERRPFETYIISFNTLGAYGVRLIGTAGGFAQFTSLARIAVYQRDFSRWKPKMLPPAPVPYFFRLISPQTVWDLSENLMRLSGLTISFPLALHYLDQPHFDQYVKRFRRNYQGEPDLWFLINDTLGWNDFSSINWLLIEQPDQPTQPHVCMRMRDLIAAAVAPVVIDGKVIGKMISDGIIVKDTFEIEAHQRLARDLGISWTQYQASLVHTSVMTMEQLQGAAGLMGMIANTIANLAHRNLHLETELHNIRRSIGQKELYRREILSRAVEFMQQNLEEDISVGDVAQAVSLSIPHLNRIFAESLHTSPGEFLINLRLERAKDYLTNTSMSVMDVCVALNYSPAYFSRLFKQRTGYTPGRYKHKSSS